MAWERNFEAKVMKIRKKGAQVPKLNYSIEVCFTHKQLAVLG